MSNLNQTYPPCPMTEEELQLIADVSNISVDKVRTIVNLAVKAVHDKGGFVLRGGKMTRSPITGAWNIGFPTETTPDNEV